jgi:uncharacterized membrane protein YdjX (TVP38/TMEM64 family)
MTLRTRALRLLADRRLWVLAGILGLLAGGRLLGLDRHLSIEALAEHRATLAGVVAGNLPGAAVAFVAVYAAVVALSVPGAAVLSLAGGFLFGPWLGTGLSVTGATIGATLVFLLARRLFGEDALARHGPRAERLAAALRRDAVAYMLVLRLAPLFPFFLVNLVPAFVGVPLAVYVATTFVGILPGAMVYTLAGAGIGAVLDAGGTLSLGSVMTPEIVAALSLLALLSLAAIPLRRRFAARDDQAKGQSGGGSAR